MTNVNVRAILEDPAGLPAGLGVVIEASGDTLEALYGWASAERSEAMITIIVQGDEVRMNIIAERALTPEEGTRASITLAYAAERMRAVATLLGQPAVTSPICRDLRHTCGKCGFVWPERSSYDELTLKVARLERDLATEERDHNALASAVAPHGGDAADLVEIAQRTRAEAACYRAMAHRLPTSIASQVLAEDAVGGDEYRRGQRRGALDAFKIAEKVIARAERDAVEIRMPEPTIRRQEGYEIRNAEGLYWSDHDQRWDATGTQWKGFSRRAIRKIAKEVGGTLVRILSVRRVRIGKGGSRCLECAVLRSDNDRLVRTLREALAFIRKWSGARPPTEADLLLAKGEAMVGSKPSEPA